MEAKDLERLANFVQMGVPATQLADVFGLSEGRISQIRDTVEFKDLMLRKYAEGYEKQEEFNSGWDAVEKSALKIVVDKLKITKDPDYALKAAVLSNRANRRGSVLAPVLPTDMGARVVVNISNMYLDKMQTADKGISATVKTITQQKRVDLLGPKQVVDVLESDGQTLDELPDD